MQCDVTWDLLSLETGKRRDTRFFCLFVFFFSSLLLPLLLKIRAVQSRRLLSSLQHDDITRNGDAGWGELREIKSVMRTSRPWPGEPRLGMERPLFPFTYCNRTPKLLFGSEGFFFPDLLVALLPWASCAQMVLHDFFRHTSDEYNCFSFIKEWHVIHFFINLQKY